MDFVNRSSGDITRYRSNLTPFYLYRRFICHQAQVIRRDCFERFGEYNTAYRMLADADLFARLVVRENLRPLHLPLIGIYYDGAGMSESAAQCVTVRSETKRFRLAHYRPVQRCWYGFATQMTLPRTRMWLLRQCRWPWLRAIYGRIAALFR
jgi:hypothetical protein